MTTMNLFEYATRHKLRFPSNKGELSAEQLFDVPLRSRDDFNLDAIAKAVNRNVKTLTEESFVETKRTPVQAKAEVALDLVKFVIESKLQDEAKAAQRAANKVERDALLAILADKQAGKMSNLSEKELQRRIEALSE